MRIVHVANFYGPGSGGIRTFMHALGRGYADAGHEMVLVVPGARAADEMTPAGRRLTLPGRRLPWSGGYRVITDLAAARRVLDRLAPDRLEVSDRLTLRPLGAWARRNGVPSVCFAHERVDGVLQAHLHLPAAVARSMADRHNLQTVQAFGTMVCTTAFAARELERIAADGVVRIPLGVELDLFHPSRRDPTLRAEYARADERLLVLCSRLSREKRPDLAVSALARLGRRGVRARLVVVGTGPRSVEARLRRQAAGLPVSFAGFVPDRDRLAALLASADVVLAPGPIETFGLAALEALASGTPVVGSSTSALAEVVTPKAGRLAPADPDAIAAAVHAVLAEPVELRRAGARHRAEMFGWQRTVDEVLELHRMGRRTPVG